MNKLSILLISSLLFLPACGGESQVNNTDPTPVPQPEFTDGGAEDPSQINPPSTSTISGLIPSTKSQERLKAVNQGKSNPFSSMRPPSVVKVTSPDIKLPANIKAFRQKAIVKPNFNSGSSANASRPGTSKNGNQVAILKTPQTGENIDAINMDNQLKSAPEIKIPEIKVPTDAQNMLVSGVLDLQGQSVALIKTPWDATSRSVRVGDVLSDPTGEINVRVEQISFRESNGIALITDDGTFTSNLGAPSGVVVLEQYGQSVTKEVSQEANSESPVEQL